MAKKTTTTAIFFAIIANNNLKEEEFEALTKTITDNNGKVIDYSRIDVLTALFSDLDYAIDVALEVQNFLITKDIKIKIGLHLTDSKHLPKKTLKDSIGTARKLAESSNDSQILITEELVDSLSPHFKNNTRFVKKIIDDNNNTINVYKLAHCPQLKAPANVKLMLSYKNKEIILAGLSDYILGRDNDCDLILKTSKVSAQHAIISRKGNLFRIKDISQKGTYVKQSAEEEICLKNDELIISDNGSISLGEPSKANTKGTIQYRVIKS